MPADAASLAKAAQLLRAGEPVAFPTETVYGLGADALSPAAVEKIFIAKARPADNPLIAHIDSLSMLDALVDAFPAEAEAVARAFWPGPLTLVLPKKEGVPAIVSAGLPTVAVRMPAHPAALALIRAFGGPIAAPSANRSGRPSPTRAAHVLEDMAGRIPLILDGGPCGFGVESTVLDMTGGIPTILRPGGVTAEMLRQVLADVRIDPAVLQPLGPGMAAKSPGMRHRHYAPKARIEVVQGAAHAVTEKIAALYDAATAQGGRPAILCSAASAAAYGKRTHLILGQDASGMAARLYDAFRTLDAQGTDLILAEASDTEGMGLALMNRLLRAADFHVVEA